jgi:small subunit ribosomal protein S20
VPQKRSAKKRLRQNEKQRAQNRRRKVWVKSAVREYEQALQEGDTAGASERLQEVYRRLDRVADKGTIHKNAAARRKSRLASRLRTTPG